MYVLAHKPTYLPEYELVWEADTIWNTQDLEEVEEWNEYGELKDHVGGPPQTATPTPSAMNTPSKAPTAPSSSTPSKPPPSPLSSTPKQNPSTSVETPPPRPPPQTATDSPLTTAMRQAGFEAAKKAGDAKKAKLFASKEPESLEGRGEKDTALDEEALKKLDTSGPTGMPPPSGTTEAEDAKEPATAGADVGSKADETPSTEAIPVEDSEDGKEVKAGVGSAGDIENLKNEGTDLPLRQGVKNKSSVLDHPHGTTEPIIAATGQKSEEGEGGTDTKRLEEDGGLRGAIQERKEEEEQPSDENDGETAAKTKDASAATDETEALPGKKTQEQGAAKGDEAGLSVGD